MSDAREVIKIGVEKVALPGWQVEVVLTERDGKVISQEKTGGLKWGEALGKVFQVEEGFLKEGFLRIPWKDSVLEDTVTGRKLRAKISWAGIPEYKEIEDLLF